MAFIELTTTEGNFIGNVDQLQRVFRYKGKTCVSGWNNNGFFEVLESYEEVVSKVTKALSSSKTHMIRKVKS